jgi:hypothetical protein
MKDRNALTKILLTQWDKSTDEANVIFYSRIWWKSNRVTKNASYSLTPAGFDFFVNTLDLKAYEVPFNVSIEKSPQTTIFLNRYVKCPFYLTDNSITVFSEIKSFELTMFSDDIRKYGIIKSLKDRQTMIKNKSK